MLLGAKMKEEEIEKLVEGETETVIPATSTEELLNRISHGANLYSDLSADFIQEKLIFYGKSLFDWATEMTVEIPNDLDESSYRTKLTEIANKLQKANNYCSAAISMEETISGGSRLTKDDIIRAIVEDYKKRGAKRPAGSIIESLANSYLSETVSTHIAAHIVKDFWKKRIESIITVKDILEQIGMSLHVEAKHLTR